MSKYFIGACMFFLMACATTPVTDWRTPRFPLACVDAEGPTVRVITPNDWQVAMSSEQTCDIQGFHRLDLMEELAKKGEMKRFVSMHALSSSDDEHDEFYTWVNMYRVLGCTSDVLKDQKGWASEGLSADVTCPWSEGTEYRFYRTYYDMDSKGIKLVMWGRATDEASKEKVLAAFGHLRQWARVKVPVTQTQVKE